MSIRSGCRARWADPPDWVVEFAELRSQGA